MARDLSSAEDESLATEVAMLREQVALLTDRLARLEAPPGTSVSVPPVPPAGEAEESDLVSTSLVDRRTAIRRGAGMAAAAVAGGAAVVAGTPGIAAAATLTGSGNPGVSATGTGGDGVVATTNNAGSAAVRGATANAAATGVAAANTDGGTALQATTNGLAGKFTGGTGTAKALTVDANGTAQAVAVAQLGTGSGIAVTGAGAGSLGTGITVIGMRTAAELKGTKFDLVLDGGSDHLLLLSGNTTTPPTRAVSQIAGTLTYDGDALWFCTDNGNPGTWRKLSGFDTAGQLHVLQAPARIYDSRPGTQPAVGVKSPLTGGTTRELDLTVNSSGVPAGATAALVTILLVNATAGNGNFTIWRRGQAKPASNTLVWGPGGGRFAITAVTALDVAAMASVSASLTTDLVVDVVGYYR